MPLAAVKSLPAIAVPLTVAKATVTGWVLAGDRVTAKLNAVVPPVPSASATFPIDKAGESSLVIVPWPVALPKVAYAGRVSVTVIVSSGLPRRCRRDSDGHGLGRFAGGEAQRARSRGEVGCAVAVPATVA